MTARYSIMVKEYGSDHYVELATCSSNPEAIADGARAKTLTIRSSIFEPGKRVKKVAKYDHVMVVDHGDR